MNTIQITLNEAQYNRLQNLLCERVEEAVRTPSDSYEDDADLWHAISNDPSYLWSSNCGHLHLEIPMVVVCYVTSKDDIGAAAQELLEEEGDNPLRAQVERINLNDIRPYLQEVGVEGVKGMHESLLRSNLLIMACKDIINRHESENHC